MITKEEFLEHLQKLEEYVDDGIRDYLHDNSLADYIEHGDFAKDLSVYKAILLVRAWVVADEYPYWKEDDDPQQPTTSP